MYFNLFISIFWGSFRLFIHLSGITITSAVQFFPYFPEQLKLTSLLLPFFLLVQMVHFPDDILWVPEGTL